ncbi:lectin-like domain-containing protein [Levilactobacillus yiduensis]|uniref:lectin-like domain-containing protein n=1 Tax=Levilactobacillus yiduensis TaxID=2953880 RepID=UPI002157242B|nr:hypothetical protein [Levilactobacillus yiduensis]
MKWQRIWLSILVALACMLSGMAIAHADTPDGLPITPYFKTGNFTGASNSATLVANAAGQKETVQLTDAANQLGTIWADKDNYYFELNHDQKASMWMYFDNKGSSAGDGMAFVLQNDPNGTAAVSRTALTNVPAAGETLGVWGSPDNYTVSGTNNVASQAIQNSWALEFDTFPNTQPIPDALGKSTTFDSYINYVTDENTKKPHIASNYPAQSATYNKRYYAENQYYTVMLHKGILNPALSNGAWHHVTLKYTAPSTYPGTGKMTYTFDDKDAATGLATATTATTTVDINTSIVDPENTGKAMWGFTGSTGQHFETNQVVFEQIPGLVDASAVASMYDRTEDDVQVPANGMIMGGDRLLLKYDLTYNSGRKAWDNVQAALAIPDNLNVTSGKVTYADGTQETVDLSGYRPGDKQLMYTLQKGLSTANKTASISLYATAENPTAGATVDMTTSKFSSPLGIATADLSGFGIVHSTVDLAAKVTSGETVNVLPGKTTTVTGTATLQGATSNAQFTLHPTLNGQDLAPATFSSQKQSDGSFTGQFSYQPLVSDLHLGLNTLTLYVSDAMGNSSPDVTVTINVAGILSYANVPQTVTFTDTQLTGASQLISREGDWNLLVNDARGSGSKWQLTAQLTKPMTATTKPATQLDGSLQYRASDTATPVTIGTTAVPVATHTTTSDDETTNATGWDAGAGMLLHVNSSATSGTYTGEITWNLANAPS